MKVRLTGTTAYIGKRLLHVLLERGHEVICCVRVKDRFDTSAYPKDKIRVIEASFLYYVFQKNLIKKRLHLLLHHKQQF